MAQNPSYGKASIPVLKLLISRSQLACYSSQNHIPSPQDRRKGHRMAPSMSLPWVKKIQAFQITYSGIVPGKQEGLKNMKLGRVGSRESKASPKVSHRHEEK